MVPVFIEPANTKKPNSIEVARQFLVGYAKSTREAYGRDLETWFEFCASASLEPLQAPRAAIDTFARLLSESKGLSAASVARSLAAVSGYYRFAVEEGFIDHNPAAGVRRPKVGSDAAPTGLTAEELSNLIKRARADSPRAYALVMLLAMNGLRISEALNANVSDLGEERGQHTLKITRKGGKTQTIPLLHETYAAIIVQARWENNGPIFSTVGGGRLHRSDAWKLLRRLGDYHPHQLRHAFVTLSLESGAALHDVQRACGHSSPTTTMRYAAAIDGFDKHPGKALKEILL